MQLYEMKYRHSKFGCQREYVEASSLLKAEEVAKAWLAGKAATANPGHMYTLISVSPMAVMSERELPGYEERVDEQIQELASEVAKRGPGRPRKYEAS